MKYLIATINKGVNFWGLESKRIHKCHFIPYVVSWYPWCLYFMNICKICVLTFHKIYSLKNSCLYVVYEQWVVKLLSIINVAINQFITTFSETSIIWHYDNLEYLCNLTTLTTSASYLVNPTTSFIWHKILANLSVGLEKFHCMTSDASERFLRCYMIFDSGVGRCLTWRELWSY